MDKLYKAKKRPIVVRMWKEDYEKEIIPIIKEFRETWGKDPSIPFAINIRFNKKELRKKKDEQEEKFNIF